VEQQPEAHNNESLFKIIDFSQSRVIELVLHQVVWGFCVSFYLQEDLSCSTRQLYNLSFFVFFFLPTIPFEVLLLISLNMAENKT